MIKLFSGIDQKLRSIRMILFIGLFSLTAQASENSLNKYLKNFINSFQFLKTDKNDCIGLITIETSLEKSKKIINKLLEMRDDPKVKGIIIHFDCTGGVIGTCQAIFSELKKIKEKKPVIVIVENYCLSGAYYIATAADYIFAMPSSEIGGIGIISFIKKYKEVKFSENQITATMEPIIIRSGKYKDPANYYAPLDEEMIEDIRQRAWKKYKQFIFDIAQARKLSLEDEKLWADGKSFVGTEALELGLIDAIGDFTDALIVMHELIKQRGSAIEVRLAVVDFTL